MAKTKTEPWFYLNDYRGKDFAGEWPTFPEMLKIQTSRYPDRPYFVDFDGPNGSKNVLTYAQVFDKVQNLAKWMIANGLEKGDKVVDLFFNREVKELLIKLKEQRELNGIDTEYVFISKKNGEYRKVVASTLGQWAKKIGIMIGLEHGLHCHDFRHSGATLLKNAGMPLEEVSTLLNHASTDVTRKFYIKEDNKKLKQSKAKYEI